MQMSHQTPRRDHEIRSFYIRLVLGVVMALVGTASLFTAPSPETFTQHDGNRTVLLANGSSEGWLETAHSSSSSNNTFAIVQLRYLPVGLRHSGADAIFIATLIAVVAGGAYAGSVIPRVETEIKNTSKDKVEYDTRMSNAGWEQLDRLAGPLDRCLCLLYMMVASLGIALATAISFSSTT